MSMNMPAAVYWYKNQIAVTFQSDLLSSDIYNISVINKKREQHLQHLNRLLKNPDGTGFTLTLLENTNMGAEDAPADAGSLDGICLYPAPTKLTLPSGAEPMYDLIDFYKILPPPTQGGNGSTGGMGGMNAMDGMGENTGDLTVQVLKQLYAKKDTVDTPFEAPFDAMPYWFYAGTGDPTHGCPIIPPFPAARNSTAGQWKFMPPQVANTTGAGVTVFVLDAFPTAAQITSAAKNPGCDNSLLQGIAKGMVSVEPANEPPKERATPPAISLNYFDGSKLPQDVTTGKDIYGRLAGFPLIDHGLTIAGIIRDLAPGANIECIRVLNDYAVGDVQTLINALTYISVRMQPPRGDLYNKPVVINLSLVIGPPEGDLSRLELDDKTVQQFLTALHRIIQTLTLSGAILVASSGNDSDPRDPMHAAGTRLGPRYPAAFAYDASFDPPTVAAIIPVGAINGQKGAASYSNYPGADGIAAYGGEIPKPYPPLPDPTVITQLDPTVPLDVVRGVYSSSMYPALSMDDKYPAPSPQPPAYPEYPAPDASAWTCWAGTSFATPVISALAACLLQGQQQVPYTIDVRQVLKDLPATQQVMWTGLASGEIVAGPAIMVMQEFKPS